MKTKILTTTKALPIGQGWSRIENRTGWTDGWVVTPHGIVCIYSQGDDNYYHFTRLDFAWNGIHHIKTFDGKRYPNRYIVTLAKRFAQKIAFNQP